MLRRVFFAVSALFRRAEVDRDLDDELAFHLDMETQAHMRRGFPEEAARRQAARSLGSAARLREDCAEARGTLFVETLIQDVRYGLRMLLRAPMFTGVVILTLALGIGANAAIFSVVHAVLLRPLPYRDGDRLVVVRQPIPSLSIEDARFSVREIEEYREQAQSLESLVEYHHMWFNLLGRGEPRRVQTGVVSASFFDVLGVTPILGRSFRADDDRPGAEPVLLLGYGYWQRAFGGDPLIVGQRFEMNLKVHTVVGVLPPIPQYPIENDVYMPSQACPFRSNPSTIENRNARLLRAFGRIRPETTVAQASAELATIASRFRQAFPDSYREASSTATADALREELVAHARPTLLLLLGTAAFVLLIVCANVANLMLARMLARQREMAVRAALGAGRRRLVRQLLTESGVLALTGGALGLVVARGTLDLLIRFTGRFTERASEITIDGGVLAFTLAVSVVSGLLFGILPALTRTDLVTPLKDGGDRSTLGLGGQKLRQALIVSQFAVSFVLLIGAGLMLRTVYTLQTTDGGFIPQNVLTVSVDLDFAKYKTDEDYRQFYRPVLNRVRALPGVSLAALSSTFPLDQSLPQLIGFRVEGRSITRDQPLPQADFRAATAGYFETIGVSVVRGRTFTEADTEDAPKVAIVNQSMARRYWQDDDPIGSRVSVDEGETWLTVVGVVSDVKQYGLDRAPADELYLSFLQTPLLSSSIVLRTDGDPTRLGNDVRQAVYAIDPTQPVAGIKTLEEAVTETLAAPRLTASLLALFALVAVAVTAAGIAGVIAFSVSQRRQEIGIRVALGAGRASVLGMLLRQGCLMAGAGLFVGLLAARVLTGLMGGLLFGVEPTDPLTFTLVGAVLIGVAIVASLLPARRALTIPPTEVVRGA
jgi:predicted permease